MKALRKDQCERSLLAFVKTFWPVVEPSTTLLLGKTLEVICQHLEAVSRGDIQKILINVPPGSMKSLLTNVFWPAWAWCTQPHLRYVAFSYSVQLTERDNRKFLSIVSSPLYQEFWGDRVKLVKQGETLVSNTATGSKLATSFKGVGTGERGDVVLLDDPHNVKDGESEAIRTSTTEWFTSAMSNRLNDLRTSRVVIIMQRVHEEDVSGVILSRKLGYDHLMIPAEYEPERAVQTSIGWRDWRTQEGESFWPERYPLPVLNEMARTQGSYQYAGQYQQRPEVKGGGILKRDWWKKRIADKKHPWPVFDYIVASIDTAYTEKQENDPSALTIWGVYQAETVDGRVPRVMLRKAWEDRLTLHDLVNKVGDDCALCKVDCLLIESKASGISVSQEIRRLYNTGAKPDWQFAVRLIDPKGQDKTARAHAISHLLEEGMVEAPYTERDGKPDQPWPMTAKVIDQCAKFPRATHDDLVDTTTQALRHLRAIGLLTRKPEIDAAEREAMAAPVKSPKLYPVSG